MSTIARYPDVVLALSIIGWGAVVWARAERDLRRRTSGRRCGR